MKNGYVTAFALLLPPDDKGGPHEVDEKYAVVRFFHQWFYMLVMRSVLHPQMLEGA